MCLCFENCELHNFKNTVTHLFQQRSSSQFKTYSVCWHVEVPKLRNVMKPILLKHSKFPKSKWNETIVVFLLTFRTPHDQTSNAHHLAFNIWKFPNSNKIFLFVKIDSHFLVVVLFFVIRRVRVQCECIWYHGVKIWSWVCYARKNNESNQKSKTFY